MSINKKVVTFGALFSSIYKEEYMIKDTLKGLTKVMKSCVITKSKIL